MVHPTSMAQEPIYTLEINSNPAPDVAKQYSSNQAVADPCSDWKNCLQDGTSMNVCLQPFQDFK